MTPNPLDYLDDLDVFLRREGAVPPDERSGKLKVGWLRNKRQ